MALIFEGKSKCTICNNSLRANQDTIAWSAFLGKEHKLWKYSDSGMHQNCFNKWIHKEEFEYNYKLQPLIDFENPELKEQIKNYGMPDWLKELEEYRKNN